MEKITAHTEIPSVPTGEVGNERSVSRAKVEILVLESTWEWKFLCWSSGQESGISKWKFLCCARILRSRSQLSQANDEAVSLKHRIYMHPRSKDQT